MVFQKKLLLLLYKDTKVMVLLPDGDTDFFDIITEALQKDSLAPYLSAR